MSNRGYCTERICSNKTAYHNSPTPLQKASYHSYLVNVARSDDIAGLTDLISSGLSPNPANNFGESLCHTICRLGNSRLLQCLLDCGATLDFCDDYGRTPLHDACWTAIPAFDVVDLIMTWRGNVDTYHLFTMVDSRGSTPLSYIRREHWAEWLEFLVAKKDVYWPAVDKSQGKKDAPAITRELPHSRPRPDPENALSVELAGMVASGIMSPIEARLLVEDDSESSDDEDDDDSDSDSDCDDSDSDDSDSDDCSSSSCSDDEEECILLDEASMSSILMHIQETDRTRLIPCMSH